MKRCCRCGDEKPKDTVHFHKCARSKDGLQHYCKACMREYARMHKARVLRTRRANREIWIMGERQA